MNDVEEVFCLTQVDGVVEVMPPNSTLVPFLSFSSAAAPVTTAAAATAASNKADRMKGASNGYFACCSVNAAHRRPARAATSPRLGRIEQRPRPFALGVFRTPPFRTDVQQWLVSRSLRVVNIEQM